MSASQCNLQLLHKSMEDVLSQRDEDWLVEHLENCEHCQEKLENLAGDVSSWSRVELVLRDEVSGTQPLAKGMISGLIPASETSGTGAATDGFHSVASRASQGQYHGPFQANDFAVEFLEPGVEADSIGRLDDIEIRAVIGHGGNGIVLKGFQAELNRLVAVKVMAPQLAASPEARKRFAREAQATAAVVHPNVMPVLSVHSSSRLPYLVMPYVDCESLQQRLDREGALPELDVLRIAHQVASGLAAAHAQGLVHRDVKPANILLERNVERVMLTDFGLARAMDDATLTCTGLIAGTPQYMSPEQARGDSVSARSDLFSLGSVMYAMSTGRPPFRAQTSYGILRRVIDDQPRCIRELNSAIPTWMDGLIIRLLEKESESRMESAEVLAGTLRDCIAHVQQPKGNPLPESVVQYAHSQIDLPRWRTDWWRAGPLLKASLATVGIVLLVIGVQALSGLNRDRSNGPSGDESQEVKSASPSELESANNEGTVDAGGRNFPANPLTTGPDSLDWEDGVDVELEQLGVDLQSLLMDMDVTELDNR